MKQLIKDFLVGLGPRNPLVHTALKLHGCRSRSVISFAGGCISLARGKRK
jgi:hypothetical protein